MKCPVCSSEDCTNGLVGSSNFDVYFPPTFTPERLRFSLRKKSIKLSDKHQFSACLKCGHLWASVDQYELKRIIKNFGLSPIEQSLSERWAAMPYLLKAVVIIISLTIIWVISTNLNRTS